MTNQYYNGHMREEPTQVEKLTAAMESLTTTVEKLIEKTELQSARTELLSNRIETFIHFASNSIPSNIVYLIFILVFGVLLGIESIQFVFTHFLPGLVK